MAEIDSEPETVTDTKYDAVQDAVFVLDAIRVIVRDAMAL